jgi:hypothetical protein
MTEVIRRTPLLDEFERDQLRRPPSDPETNRRIYAELFERARSLGVFPLADPLEGIDVDIRLAKALNAPRAPRSHH